MNTKEYVKGLILEYERSATGADRLNDVSILVKNIRINKTMARADVIEVDFNMNSQIRRNNLQYNLNELKEFHKNRVL